MIQGYFTLRNRPYISCRLHIARFDILQPIQLMFDTGADITCLHPSDADEIGVPFQALRNPQNITGIGKAEYFREPATLFFVDGDVTHLYHIEINVAIPNDDNRNLPSILGRDIFDFWSTNYDPFNKRLEAEAHSAHATLPSSLFSPSSG
ncbi:MAG: hypothetical protein F4Y49_07595 [Dehalococcoidia bacterium]|nr:hypothetical protein [Dehalococcoidia bacterium]